MSICFLKNLTVNKRLTGIVINNAVEGIVLRFWGRQRFLGNRRQEPILAYMEVFTASPETFADSKIVGYH